MAFMLAKPPSFGIRKSPDTAGKLAILAEAAKYDVSCASSGSAGNGPGARMGSCSLGGICHSWSADGRCISLLKVLFSNACVFDCAFCANRRSNNVPRATFSVEEMVDLTMNFYVRNYIEGLFLSSGIWSSPNRTMECLVRVAETLRRVHGFGGYIHLKAIPGADATLVARAGRVADRLSINIELPSEESLTRLAPQKSKALILNPMRQIGNAITEYHDERRRFRSTPSFAPAGQSTQLVIGASPERDNQILRLSESLYQRFSLKRVYYSAYVPVNDDSRLPALSVPPLLREHRLYQADWLLRFYGFRAEELLDEQQPDLDEAFDPKTGWALRHPEFYPVDVNRADCETLLRVPGLGVRSAKRIVDARRFGRLRYEDLKALGVVMKRARFFVACAGHSTVNSWNPTRIRTELLKNGMDATVPMPRQLELF